MARALVLVSLLVSLSAGGLMPGVETHDVGMLTPSRPSAAPSVLISAVYYDGYAPGDADEALQLWNTGPMAVQVGGWLVADEQGTAGFPSGAGIPSGRFVWLARDAEAFRRSFGHWPDWSWGPSSSDRLVPRMVTAGDGPSLGNDGDRLELRRPSGVSVDAVIYGTHGTHGTHGTYGTHGTHGTYGTYGDAQSVGGWEGPSVRSYRFGSVAGSNQVLYRKLDPATGIPVADTDRRSDWASDPDDPALGRRVRFPGWDVEGQLRPRIAREAARVEIALAPDALHGFLRRHFELARASVDLFSYTFEHPDLAELLAARASAGARVRVLLDGSPVGGISHDQRWCLTRIADAGGEVYWLANGGPVHGRYRSAHAKLAVIDDRTVLLGSENVSLGAAPHDDRADGTAGRRGLYVATDAPSVVDWVRDLVARDLDPGAHVDVRPFQRRDPARGAPAPDYEPVRVGGGAGYAPLAPEPVVLEGAFGFELVTAPERAVDPGGGLLGLLARAGEGDEVLVEQLAEPVWWGAGSGDESGMAALNPRVQAYVAAARRGARVRVLLDAYFDDAARPGSNAVTVAYLNAAAATEGVDLAARLGNPAGLGLHNKMVLVALRGQQEGAGPLPLDARAGPSSADAAHWLHVGSLNGSEVSSKANREVVLQVESAAVYRVLAPVFAWDWARSGAHLVWLPYLASNRP